MCDHRHPTSIYCVSCTLNLACELPPHLPTGQYLQLQHHPLTQAPEGEVAGVEVEHHLEGEAGQHLVG